MKIFHTLPSMLIILILSSCSGKIRQNKQAHIAPDTDHIIYDLNDSTDIIVRLIKEDRLTSVLVDHDPVEITNFIKNFSPSEMALEAEALNYEGIVGLIFFKVDEHWKKLQQELIHSAKSYPSIKFVQVNAEILFKVTENAQIDIFPALIFLENRKEIERIEPINDATLRDDIARLIIRGN